MINDPLAVAYFADRSLCDGIEAYTEIETQGISIGQSVVDSQGFYRRESNSVVLTKVNAAGFFRMFFGRLLNQSPEKLDLLERMIS